MKIRVIIARPNELAEITEIENDLETYQAIVGGYIECLTLDEKAILICNEEGKLKGLPDNFAYKGDVIVGTVVIVGIKNNDFAGLSQEEAIKIRNRLDLTRADKAKKRILQEQDPDRLKY